MIPQKMCTERQAILREREAFVAGWMRGESSAIGSPVTLAAEKYPLPLVAVPREKVDSGWVAWRVVGEEIQWRKHDINPSYWAALSTVADLRLLTPERIRIIVNLLDDPTHEVEDDGSFRFATADTQKEK